MLAGADDLVQPGQLLPVMGLVLHEAGQADDGIHRGAYFVAHVGQEGALGDGGRFGGFLRLAPLDFERFAGAEVDMRADRAHRLTAGVTFDHLAAAEYPFVAAILAAQAEFDFVAALLCQFVTDQSNGLLALFAGELCHKDVMHIVAEFARRIAQHGAVGGVYVSLAGAQVPVPDAIAGGFQREFVAFFTGADLRHHVRQRGSAFGHHGFQLGLAVALFGFYPLAFGDVVGDAEDADDPALSVVHRCLGCFEHALVAIRSEGEYFFIARRAASGDGGLIVVAEEFGLLVRHEIEIGFADDGCCRGTDTTLETLVAGEVDAVAVFQPDQVGNGLQQGLQVGPLAR